MASEISLQIGFGKGISMVFHGSLKSEHDFQKIPRITIQLRGAS
jgi:hypothetical protein